jgi:hypothetical protein
MSAASRHATGSSAARSPRQSAIDRGQRVHVYGVDVVDVVVHAPHHRRKLRDHREQQAHLVQLAQDRAARELGDLHHLHQIREGAARGLVLAQPRAERLRSAGSYDRLPGCVVDQRVALDGEPIHAHREHRIFLERCLVDQRDAPVDQLETAADVLFVRRLAGHGQRTRDRHAAGELDAARVPVVVAHERLDAGSARRIAHGERHALLLLEDEPIGEAARRQVQVIAQVGEKAPGQADVAPLALGERAHAHHALEVFDAEARARRPARDVEITQAAGAVLHVGLEQKHRAAEALVPLHRALLQARQETRQLARAKHLREGALHQLVGEHLIARDVTEIEQ